MSTNYYLVGGGWMNPIVWDGVSSYTPEAGYKIWTAEQKKAWDEANPLPPYDPETEMVYLDPVTDKWKKEPLPADVIASKNKEKQRAAAFALLPKFDAKNATNAEIQTTIAALIRGIV